MWAYRHTAGPWVHGAGEMTIPFSANKRRLSGIYGFSSPKTCVRFSSILSIRLQDDSSWQHAYLLKEILLTVDIRWPFTQVRWLKRQPQSVPARSIVRPGNGLRLVPPANWMSHQNQAFPGTCGICGFASLAERLESHDCSLQVWCF